MYPKNLFFTSESVTEGHPDKFCDKISDAVLDECLRNDPMSRVACETYVTLGLVNVGGEITTSTLIDVAKVAREIGNEIGYVVLVWEDNAYGLIAWKQQKKFGHHTDLAFGNPKWTTLAQAFGWHGHYVENSVDLRDTLEAAFTEKGPSLVVIPIDYRENALLAKKIGEIIFTI